jgi:hypothetical protein
MPIKARARATCPNADKTEWGAAMSSISGKTDPVVLRIGAADVIDALGKGLRDFQAMPLYGMALGAPYAAA